MSARNITHIHRLPISRTDWCVAYLCWATFPAERSARVRAARGLA